MLTAFSGTQSRVFLKNSAYGFRADLRIRKFSFSKTDKKSTHTEQSCASSGTSSVLTQ